MANVLIFYLTLVITCTYAILRGSLPERIGAGIFIAATVLSGLAASSRRPGFETVELGILAVDTGMFVAFLVLALLSKRYWPLWMTALQAVQVAGHLARLVDPEIIPWAYAVAQGFWSYPMMAILIAATRRHQVQMRMARASAPLSNSSPGSPPKRPTNGPAV